MNDDYSTYEQLAESLQASRDTVYGVASRNAEIFKPDEIVGTQYYFSPDSVARIRAWWEDHSRFRAKPRTNDTEPAYTVEELKERLNIPFTTVQYYRRRYGMLYPDYYTPNPTGRGRPVAMYRQSTIDEWRRWVEDGRPEPGYMRVKSVALNQGLFDATVLFGDGTMAGLRGDEWRISPPPDDETMAAEYIKFANRWVEMTRYRERWKRDKKENIS